MQGSAQVDRADAAELGPQLSASRRRHRLRFDAHEPRRIFGAGLDLEARRRVDTVQHRLPDAVARLRDQRRRLSVAREREESVLRGSSITRIRRAASIATGTTTSTSGRTTPGTTPARTSAGTSMRTCNSRTACGFTPVKVSNARGRVVLRQLHARRSGAAPGTIHVGLGVARRRSAHTRWFRISTAVGMSAIRVDHTVGTPAPPRISA